MVDLLSYMPYPKGLKEFIWNKTDYQTNPTASYFRSRHVEYIQMFEGKPLCRIFGFVSCTKKSRYKKDMLIQEVARYYDGHQYIGNVEVVGMGMRCPIYYGRDSNRIYDHFEKRKGMWLFYPLYHMTDLKEFNEENGFVHTGWEIYTKEAMIPFEYYIALWMKYPQIELLVKAGLGRFVKYLRYLDTSKKSLHEIFKIRQECVPLLQNKDFGLRELFICRKTGWTDLEKIRARVGSDNIVNQTLRYEWDTEIKDVMKREETKKYLNETLNMDIHGSDYVDYLRDLKKLGALSDQKALYPKNFMEAHVDAMKKIKGKQWERLQPGFDKAYRKNKKYIYDSEEYLIRPVKEVMELYLESEQLCHCVRNYAENVAAETTEIFFIRKKEEPDRPFYTLELKNKRIIQIRGFRNTNPDDQIKDFIGKWAREYRLAYTGEQPNYRYY